MFVVGEIGSLAVLVFVSAVNLIATFDSPMLCIPSIFFVFGVLSAVTILVIVEVPGLDVVQSFKDCRCSNVSGELGTSAEDEDEFREAFRNLNFRIFLCRNNCLRGKYDTWNKYKIDISLCFAHFHFYIPNISYYFIDRRIGKYYKFNEKLEFIFCVSNIVIVEANYLMRNKYLFQ